MKYRPLPIGVTPMHRFMAGVKAPTIYVDTDDEAVAIKIAKQRSRLSAWPERWAFIIAYKKGPYYE